MFNKTLLRLTLQLPPLTQTQNSSRECIIKSTALSNNPIQVQTTKTFAPNQVLSIINKDDLNVYQYTYTINSYVESYNFLRIYRGIGNVVFSS